MPHGDRYVAQKQITVSTAISVLQLAAGATTPFKIIEAWCTQDSSTTSAQEEISFVRKTAAATVTALVVGTDLLKLHPDFPTPDLQLGAALSGHTATAEGTDGDVVYTEAFNVLAGWKYQPIPDSRIIVDSAGIIALKFLAAPASHDFHFGIVIEEL
jgi:hypothetical protein